MLSPMEQNKQNEYLEDDFKLINHIQKQIDGLSDRLEHKSERMSSEMKEMQKKYQEYELQEIHQMEQIITE